MGRLPMLRSPCGMKNVLALVAILSLATACAPQKHEESGTKAGRTYTVRGQVTQLPDPAHPGGGTSSRAWRSHNQQSPLRQSRRRRAGQSRRHARRADIAAMQTFRPGYAFWRHVFTHSRRLDRVRQRH